MSELVGSSKRLTRSPVLAEDAILRRHGASKFGSGEGEGLDYSGWRFSAFHSTILDKTELNGLASRIRACCGSCVEEDELPDDKILVDGVNLHLPPMVFANDHLHMQHSSSGVSFYSDAEHSLSTWAVQHSEDHFAVALLGPGALGKSSMEPIIQVPYANEWSRANSAYIDPTGNNKAEARRDECTAAAETVVPPNLARPPGPGPGHNHQTKSLPSISAEKPRQLHKFCWDWTFSSDYCGSYCWTDPDQGLRRGIISARQLSQHASMSRSVPFQWSKVGSSGVDRTLLQRRDDILFYDELLLYEDDLEDCGEVTLDAKLRVMQTCWFSLQRLFVRVDGATSRIRETRLFHQFGSKQVFMEIQWKEGTLQLPRGASSSSSSRVPPLPNVRDAVVVGNLIPDKTKEQNIHPYYQFLLP